MGGSNKNVLIIGMGNVLMQDEGVGVRTVEELECRYEIPDGVTVIDGGTTGMELFEPIRHCDYLIVADAVNTGDPSGSVVRIVNDGIPAFFQTKLSNHQLGLSDLLALLTLKGELPKHIAIIGMVPYSLENRLGLTPESTAGLDRMVEMVVAELCGLGIQPRKRERFLTGSWRREADRGGGRRMCIGIPVRVVESGEFISLCEGRYGRERVNMMLVGQQPEGTWLLNFLGSAREVISERDAIYINKALDGLTAIMHGESDLDMDSHFPDIGAARVVPTTGG